MLHDVAIFYQDTFDVRIVTAKPVSYTTDFLKADETDLLK